MHENDASSEWDQAADHLRAGEWSEAAAIGRRLIDAGEWRGHQVVAGALAGDDDLDGAVKHLEDAITRHPSRRLWLALGNYRSDLERYADAMTAFERALEQPDDEIEDGFVWINIAILHSREKRFSEAHRALDRVDTSIDDLTRLRTHDVRFRCWNLEGRYDETIEQGTQVIEGVDSDSDGDSVSFILLHIAEALWRGPEDLDEARSAAIASFRWAESTQSYPLATLRRLNNLTSPSARYYRILVQFDLPEPDEDGNALACFAPYEVAADSPYEALEMIREVEDEFALDSLRIDEVETLVEKWDGLLGVYGRDARYAYPKNAPEDDEG